MSEKNAAHDYDFKQILQWQESDRKQHADFAKRFSALEKVAGLWPPNPEHPGTGHQRKLYRTNQSEEREK